MQNEKDLLKDLNDFIINSGKTITNTFEKMSKDLHNALYQTCPRCDEEFLIHIKTQKAPAFCPACGFELNTKKNEQDRIAYVEKLTPKHIEQVKYLDFESGLDVASKFSEFSRSKNATMVLYGVFAINTKRLVGYCETNHASGEFFKDCLNWSDNERAVNLFYVLPCNDKDEYSDILLDYVKNDTDASIFAPLVKPEDIRLFQKHGFGHIGMMFKFNTNFGVYYYKK